MRVHQRAAVGTFKDTATYYDAGSGNGPRGSTSFGVCVVYVPVTVSPPSQMGLLTCASVGGYYISQSSDDLIFRMRDGSGTTRTANASNAILAANLFRPHVILCTLSADVGRVHVNGVEMASGGCVGWTPDATAAFRIGQFAPGAGPMTHGGVMAVLASDTAAPADPAAASAAIQADIEQGRDIDPPAGLDEWYWDARDVASSGVPRGTWIDRVAGLALSRVGSPQSYSYAARFA